MDFCCRRKKKDEKKELERKMAEYALSQQIHALKNHIFNQQQELALLEQMLEKTSTDTESCEQR